MKTVIIAGGSGMIGKRLTQLLWEKGYRIIVLTRKQEKDLNNDLCWYAHWDPHKKEIDKNVFQDADYLINLAGASIAEKEWTSKRKQIILQGRIESAGFLLEALVAIKNKIKVVVNASAIGFYGNDTLIKMPFKEEAPPSDDFLGKTCLAWEAAITPVLQLDKRLVILRTGVVLSKDGGMYHEMNKILNFRITPVFGNGNQFVSWIHMDDICNAYIHAIENENMQWIYNACASQPVTNRQLAITMAKSRFGMAYLSVGIPVPLLKMFLGERAGATILNSTTASAKKLLSTGFKFKFPIINRAVEALMQNE